MKTASLAVILLVLALSPARAAPLNCNTDSLAQCGPAGCEAPNPSPSSLSLDYKTSFLSYCLGAACYEGKVAIVRSEGAELIAFNGRRAQPGEPRSSGWLITIHPGRRAATVGRFETDGSVSFAKLACEGQGR